MAIEWIVCSIVVCPNIHVWCGSSWNTWAILLFLPWTSNSRSRDYLNVLLGTVILYFLLMSRWHEIQESIPVIQTKMQKLCALLFSLARYTFPKLITTLHIEWCSVQIHIFFCVAWARMNKIATVYHCTDNGNQISVDTQDTIDS